MDDFWSAISKVDIKSASLPEDTAAVLRDMASRLNQMADQVLTINAKPFSRDPIAYVIRGNDGEVVDVKMTLMEANETGFAFAEIMSDEATITPEPMTNHRALLKQWRAVRNLANGGGGDAVPTM